MYVSYKVNKCKDILSTLLFDLLWELHKEEIYFFNSESFYIHIFLYCIIHVCFFFYIFIEKYLKKQTRQHFQNRVHKCATGVLFYWLQGFLTTLFP